MGRAEGDRCGSEVEDGLDSVRQLQGPAFRNQSANGRQGGKGLGRRGQISPCAASLRSLRAPLGHNLPGTSIVLHRFNRDDRLSLPSSKAFVRAPRRPHTSAGLFAAVGPGDPCHSFGMLSACRRTLLDVPPGGMASLGVLPVSGRGLSFFICSHRRVTIWRCQKMSSPYRTSANRR